MKNMILECSLKPFNDEKTVNDVCRSLLEQWKPLIKDAETISVMLWTADGSEILDYTGDMGKSFEWCKYIGSANPGKVPWDREEMHMASKNALYCENPRDFTYRGLKDLIKAVKDEGVAMFPGKKILVGETFDIGPEFAVSEFKYKRHREICKGDFNVGGDKMFIDSGAVLDGDNYPYAAYPDGIPDGLDFGVFLGAQSQIFLKDMGFDFIWLSNGVGFSATPWSSTGDVFDGKQFYPEKLGEIRDTVRRFWKSFRSKCDYPVMVRGTNYGAGIDYACDGVPLYELYHSGFDFLPAPNSPWAALDYDFGLELMGHMSRIADVLDKSYLFRFYIHDPWWPNSPWNVRYERCPHDIYMPMACARIDENGVCTPPDHFSILSIDNVHGESPESCTYEPLPHLKRAFEHAPDAPSPIVWVYPVREYTTSHSKDELCEMYAGDWFVRDAINNGFPVSGVVTTDNFLKHNTDIYAESVLLCPVPKADGEFEKRIVKYALDGGKVLFYGSVKNAGNRFKKLVNVTTSEKGVSGMLETDFRNFDIFADGKYPDKLRYEPELNGGELTEILLDKNSDVKQVYGADGHCLATLGNNFAWTRAALCDTYTGDKLLAPYKESQTALSAVIARKLLGKLGTLIDFAKLSADFKSPVIMMHRHDNALYFSNYCSSMNVDVFLSLPDGAPILTTSEAVLESGKAKYRFGRAESKECRVFVKQNSGVVCCNIHHSDNVNLYGHLTVTGLENATLTYYATEYCKDHVYFAGNAAPFEYYGRTKVNFTRDGYKYTVHDFTGMLEIFTPDKRADKKTLEFFDSRDWMYKQ